MIIDCGSRLKVGVKLVDGFNSESTDSLRTQLIIQARVKLLCSLSPSPSGHEPPAACHEATST